MWVYLLMGIFFIVLGLVVHVFKWHFLIAGYNTMSKEKKAKVDTVSLGRLMGIYCYINGAVYIISGVLHALGFEIIIIPAGIVFIISTLYLVIKAQKYDYNNYDENGKLSKKALWQIALFIGIIAIVMIFVTVLMIFSLQPAKVSYLSEGLQIRGMYGDVYDWDLIESAELLIELPDIIARTNGSAVGQHLKGYFHTKQMGRVKLHVNTHTPPFINLKTDKGIIIFNAKNEDETLRIYSNIKSKLIK